MKNVVILGDGMSDFEVPELQNKTPLEYGYLPNMNYLAQNGQVGMMKTIYEDLPVGSIVANMAILGFDPYKYYPNGRASFEALAQGIHLKSNDIAFRCNLISLDENLCISDFTSGNISDGDAKSIITKLDLEDYDVEIFPGQSYRNLIIIRNTDVNVTDIESFEPHCNIKTNINQILPNGKTPEANKLIEKLRSIMLSSIDQIGKLNEQFETKADMIWLWSPSSYPSLPSFYEVFGKKGAIVAAMDFLKGIGVSSGMRFEDIPDVNGYIDTSYANKLKYAKYFLEHNDFVYVHINAPDEEGHNKDPYKKVEAMENIDHEIIGPLVRHMRDKYGDDFRVAVFPDHYTAVKDGHHCTNDIPFLVYGKGIEKDEINTYSEKSGATSLLHLKSTDFLKFFFNESINKRA